MIKYFSFEEHKINGEWIITNETVLFLKPDTDYDGYNQMYCVKDDLEIYKYKVDIEKYNKFYIVMDGVFKEVYDRLLIQQRNEKLDTL